MESPRIRVRLVIVSLCHGTRAPCDLLEVPTRWAPSMSQMARPLIRIQSDSAKNDKHVNAEITFGFCWDGDFKTYNWMSNLQDSNQWNWLLTTGGISVFKIFQTCSRQFQRLHPQHTLNECLEFALNSQLESETDVNKYWRSSFSENTAFHDINTFEIKD